MENSISEERIVKAYRAALRYGPEPFNNEQRANHVMTSQMFDFLLDMESSDVFKTRAYHSAGRLGVDACCVDWMQDVAEETDGIEGFIEAILDGYGEGREVWYIYKTSEGEEVAGPYPNKSDALRDAGYAQFDGGERHHIVKKHERGEN
jgi:hypothetical protein